MRFSEFFNKSGYVMDYISADEAREKDKEYREKAKALVRGLLEDCQKQGFTKDAVNILLPGILEHELKAINTYNEVNELFVVPSLQDSGK